MKGKLYVLIGESGSGKSTIGRKVFGDDKMIKSVTTRKRRESELECSDYIFLTDSEFDMYCSTGEMVEKDEYNGNRYGMLSSEIDRFRNSNDNFYAVTTYKGFEHLVEILGKERVVSIYVNTPLSDRAKMLDVRGDGDLEKRLHVKSDAQNPLVTCDYIITNRYGRFNDSMEQLKTIVKINSSFKTNYKFVAIDFDGTIVEDEFPKIGRLKPYAKEVINKFKESGGRVLIHTCRTDEQEDIVREFLDDNGICYDTINENHPEMKATYNNDPRKLGADIYIDDKGYKVDGIDWLEVAKVLGVDMNV